MNSFGRRQKGSLISNPEGAAMNLVRTDLNGIAGVSYYWTRREALGITEEELRAVGIHSEHAYVCMELIRPLQQVQAALEPFGYRLLVKDGYRPPAAYELAQAKLYIKQGKGLTDAMLNMQDKPHASGLVVDLGLIDVETGEEVWLRDGADDPAGGYLIGYYLGRSDARSREFQRLQALLIGYMISAGFVLGSKQEFWHFEYRP